MQVSVQTTRDIRNILKMVIYGQDGKVVIERQHGNEDVVSGFLFKTELSHIFRRGNGITAIITC